MAGRFEQFNNNIVLDGAHNLEGTAALIQALQAVYPNRNYRFIYAALSDKDHANSIALMDAVATSMAFTQIDLPNAMPADRLGALSQHPDKEWNNNWRQVVRAAIQKKERTRYCSDHGFALFHSRSSAMATGGRTMIPKFDIYKDKWAVTSDDVIKPGLTAIAEALTLIGSPEKKLQIVHLAGTNGKGSTLTFLEAILMEHGLRVGKFMSPCILDVHDQIQVAKQPISAEEMDRVFQQMQAAGLSGKLTDFELLTVAAFLHFVNSNVDVAIIEAGMGGLLDSTNVVTPIVSIIPSIALEHTKYLGNTIESIAHHKAGIIKQHQLLLLASYRLKRGQLSIKKHATNKRLCLNLTINFILSIRKMVGVIQMKKMAYA